MGYRSMHLSPGKLWDHLRHTFHRVLRRRKVIETQQHLPLELHGNDYGGWAIVSGSLDTNSIVYSVGIGEDASFTLSLLSRYNCRVFAFDPTPKSVTWVGANIDNPRFHFKAWALGSYDGSMRLYLPKNPEHVSASLEPKAAHVSEAYVDVPCFRFDTMRQKLGHTRMDILKIDTEGAEYGIIQDLVESESLKSIGQLLVEFHDWVPHARRRIRMAIRRLEEAGLLVSWVSKTGREVLFARKPLTGASGPLD